MSHIAIVTDSCASIPESLIDSLKIHACSTSNPLIGMEDGVIAALGQARSQNRAYRSIVDMVESATNRLGKLRIACVHAAARRDVEKLQQMVQERIDCAESLAAELSPALGVHSGPGTTGVCCAPTLDSE